MGNFLGKQDNLETFLNDTYKKECEIQASYDEIKFIKEGIEDLAYKIVKCSQEDAAKHKNTSFGDGDILLKVGSFYEGTRNAYPDEFDFTFLDQPSDIDHTMRNLHKNLVLRFNESLKYIIYTVPIDGQVTTRELYFHKYIGKIGPAYTCQFIYKNEFGIQRHIYLDLVPAVRYAVTETNRDEFTQYVQNQWPNLHSFRNEILKADSYLQIVGKDYYSYNETDVHFMKNVLSSKHRKVYRILKTLINGNGDEKLLEAYLRCIGESYTFSSYKIKQSMFYHHDQCKSAHDKKLGDCVFQILIQLLENHTKKPGSERLHLEKSLPDHLKTLTINLKELQHRDGSYDYERAKMKSVPTLYFDELDKNGDRHRHARWFTYRGILNGRKKPSYDSFISLFGIPQKRDDINVGKIDYREIILNNIYKQECVIQAKDNEVDFIKSGIETLAEIMVKCSQEDTPKHKHTNFGDGDLAEKPSLLKVGSFYEETRNAFPDEFDIIFLDQPSDINHTMRSLHKNLVLTFDETLNLKYNVPIDGQVTTRELYFHKYIGKIGPAYTCQFIYKNEFGIQRHIYLDLVPAVRYAVTETNRDEFTQYVQNQWPNLHSFRNEILKADSYLQIVGKDYYSYKETEVHFMKNVISSKHKKVYRILKTLINGNGDEKLLETYLKHIDEKHIFSSYSIKQSMFYHHDQCKSAHDEKLGDCVIQILNQLLENHTKKPGSERLHLEKSLPDHLKTLTINLKELQHRDGSYYYERAKMKSVPRLYFDELDKLGDKLKRHPLLFVWRWRHVLWLDWILRHDLWLVWGRRHHLWFVYKNMLEGQEEPSYDSFITKIGIPQDKHETNVHDKEELCIEFRFLQEKYAQAVAEIFLGRD